jgi:hypothetical protein
VFTAKQGTGIGHIRIGINGRLYCFLHATAAPDGLYITFPFSLLPVPRDSFHLIPRFVYVVAFFLLRPILAERRQGVLAYTIRYAMMEGAIYNSKELLYLWLDELYACLASKQTSHDK